MVKLDRIYTGGGDRGETHLGDGSRVPKTDIRVALLGIVDELNACLGIARLYAGDLDELIGRLQNTLFDLGADLSTPLPDPADKPRLRIKPEQVRWLEAQIDRYNADLGPLTSFVLPGGSILAAHLHMARTEARRAERMAWRLAADSAVTEAALHWLNRLSDLLFVLARWANDQGAGDVMWEPGA